VEDPMKYLRVDEQATYIDVYCDGYIVRIYSNASYEYTMTRSPDNLTIWTRDYTNTYHNNGTDGNLLYCLMTDPNNTTEIIENTPTRVRIRIVGNFYSASDTQSPVGYIANSTQVIVIYTFYPDRYTKRVSWERSGNIVLANSGTEYQVALGTFYNSSIGNAIYYESSESEVVAGDSAYNSAKYLVYIADELNGQMVTLYTNDETNYDQFSYNTTYGILGIFKDCTLSGAGTLELDLMFIIDSAFREPTIDHTDLLFNWDCSDVDDLPTGLTKVGSPTNSEGGLLCDASGESITLSTSGNLDISKGTIEFWFKSNVAFDAAGDQCLLGVRGGSDSVGDFYIFNILNRVYFWIVDSSGTSHYAYYSNTSIIDDNWTSWNHYRFVWDSSAAVEGANFMALYLNGTLISANGTSAITSSWTDATLNANIGIGNDYEDTNDFMGGIMKDLFIFDQPHAKKYSSVERLEMGDQYKDLHLSNPTIGDWVKDIEIPSNIDINEFDDAYGTSVSYFRLGKLAVEKYVATKFVYTGESGTITGATIAVRAVLAPTFEVTVGVYSHDAGSDKPGTLIGSVSDPYDATGIPTTGETELRFINMSAELTNGETYWFVGSVDAVDADNYLYWWYCVATTNFIRSSGDASSWSSDSTTYSHKFKLFSTSDFATDGAHHIDPSNDVSKITWDRTRHNPAVVIHDPGIKTTIPAGTLTYIDVDDQGGNYQNVWGDGTYIYAACSGDGLRSYSVDSSGNLTYIDTDFSGGFGSYYGVWGDGTYIYAACDADGLMSYSVDGSGNLTYIDEDYQGGSYHGVWGDGTYIYVACGAAGLMSYSVDGSGNLTYIDTDYQSGSYEKVWGDGTYIYVACGGDGLRTYSVDGSGYLTYIDTDDQDGNYFNVWGDGTYIYAICMTSGLRSYSVDGSGYLTYIDTDDQGTGTYSGVWGRWNLYLCCL
jgi:hypothetical protein